jgi:hypothetical protein
MIKSDYDYSDLQFSIFSFSFWLSGKIEKLMKNEYYILFLVIAMIFVLQIGVPLIVDYFMMEDKNDDN